LSSFKKLTGANCALSRMRTLKTSGFDMKAFGAWVCLVSTRLTLPLSG